MDNPDASASAVDPKVYRHVLGHLPTGVCVVTALDATGEPVGLTVGSFTSVSLGPPLVGFFPARTSTSWPRIAAAGHFAVNVLASGQQQVCSALARSGIGKFADLKWTSSPLGCPIIDGVLVSMDCTLHAVHEAGDHLLVLGHVTGLYMHDPGTPLIFWKGRYGSFDDVSSPLVPHEH